jgi:heme a synthase
VRPPTRSSGLQRLAVVSAVATLLLIALGGAVRATDSGLACPTWPGCFTAGDFLPPRDLHVWLEHSHRLFAGVVGLLIAAVTIWVLLRQRHRPDVLWPTITAAVLVNVQALLGAFVVWRFLRAELVTAHLGLAMIITACLVAVAVNLAYPAADADGRPSPGRRSPDRALARRSTVVSGLALAQILVGGHVTGIGAGLAYRLDGFPLMDGAVFPALTAATERQLFHAGHRWLGALLLVAVAWLWWHAAQTERAPARAGRAVPDGKERWLVRLPAIATGLVALQAVIGVANLWSELSWTTVIPHLTVASWIWTVLILHTMLAYRWAPLTDTASTDEREVVAT